MNRVSKYISIIIFLLFASCTTVKDALQGKKADNSDEFLIKKKNPLVLPPEYGKLPVPKSETINETSAAEAEIEILLDSITDEASPEMSKDSKSTEEFILEQIKR